MDENKVIENIEEVAEPVVNGTIEIIEAAETVQPAVNGWQKACAGLGIAGAVAGIAYGTYKLIRHIKNKKANKIEAAEASMVDTEAPEEDVCDEATIQMDDYRK